ncbi:MAG: O-antigen ligase family protein, partial [Thermoleophilaceae bacterium]
VAAARLAPGAASAVLGGLLLAAVAIAAYGLAARVWPGAFSEGLLTGRISVPYDYWNALAGTAAVGIVPALWLGARRTGSALARAAAYPATGILIATVVIAQSRGALLGAALACVAWIALVPLRLRSIAVLAVAAAGAAPVAAWALAKDPFRLAGQPPAAREAIAGDFGLLLAALVAGLLAAGLVAVKLQTRRPLTVRARWRAGVAIAAVAAVVPLVLLTSVATSDRGLAGTVSDRVEQLTSEGEATPVGGARLSSVSSSRAGYWDEAWSAFEERPVTGLGADSFTLSRLRYRDDSRHVGHAHGFLVQTLADLGLLGLAVALALLAAWGAAAMRSAGLGRSRRTAHAAWTTERTALVALALAVVAYGVQSAIDWTWFVPGLTVMALVAAGFVAGRGPQRRPGTSAEPGHRTADAQAATGPPATRRRLRPSPPRIAGAAGVALAALLAAWVVWQPVAADRAVARSYELLDAGRPAEALREAERARDHDPYSNEPLYARAAALGEQGRDAAALATLRQAVLEHPRDPQAWLRIATFELGLGAPRAALEMVAVVVRERADEQLSRRGASRTVSAGTR